MAIVAILWLVWLGAFSCAVIAAYRCRRSPSWKAAVAFGVLIFLAVSYVAGGLTMASLQGMLGYNTVTVPALEPLIIALAPLLGLLVVLFVFRRKGVPMPLAQRWLPAAMAALALPWLFENVRATVYWVWEVDAPAIEAALAKPESMGSSDLSFRARTALPAYMEAFPSGPNIAAAHELDERVKWHDVAYSLFADEVTDPYSTQPTFRFLTQLKYLRDYPSGPHVADVLAQMNEDDQAALEKFVAEGQEPAINALAEERVFARLAGQGTVRAHQRYRELYPDSKFGEQSDAAVAALRQDPSIWERAAQSTDPKAVKQFLEDYPDHSRTADALRRREGLPFEELLADGLIEAEFGGCGIESVCGRIRRLTSYPLVVSVTPGTLFTPNDASVQTMAVTSAAPIELAGSEWIDVTLNAVCASMWRDIPGDDGSITLSHVQKDQDKRLLALGPVLSARELDYPVRQAIVWIVRDNPTREQLRSHLVRGFASVIDDATIDEALALLRGTGVDVADRRASRK